MSSTVRIMVLNNEFEARLLSEILTEKNVPHIIRSYHDSAYDGLWQVQSNWGHIEAPEEYREEILQTFYEMSRESL